MADDAPPMARVLATTLRRAAADPALAGHLRSLKGRFALKSSKDPQGATIVFGEGRVEVLGGVSRDADVVVTADLDQMGQPGAPKPKVSGALLHPVLAWKASKVLGGKAPGGWQDVVREFVRKAEGRSGLPDPLLVVNTDDGSELRVGGPGKPQLELHGAEDVLVALFGGDLHPADAWFRGRISVLADFATVTRFAGLAQSLMFGS